MSKLKPSSMLLALALIQLHSAVASLNELREALKLKYPWKMCP
jgi:hypothetical protein